MSTCTLSRPTSISLRLAFLGPSSWRGSPPLERPSLPVSLSRSRRAKSPRRPRKKNSALPEDCSRFRIAPTFSQLTSARVSIEASPSSRLRETSLNEYRSARVSAFLVLFALATMPLCYQTISIASRINFYAIWRLS